MREKLHDLHSFMDQVTDEMASEYRRIAARAAEDPGTAGDEGEENWASLLREWLPTSYHVETKGRLIGTDGSMSPQIDVLVLKPFYPPKLLEKKVWLAQGVAAAFECKTTLKAEHIRESAERCRFFKRLFPKRSGSPRVELTSPLIYGILAHSHVWKSPSSQPIEKINQALVKGLNVVEHPSERIDLLCIADLATWSAMEIAHHAANQTSEVDLRQFFGGEWGVATSMICAAIDSDDQNLEFRPIGALIAQLTRRMAWEDQTIRSLADYYLRANLWGSGSGSQQYWPASVYSDYVRTEIGRGRLRNEGGWDDWNAAVI